MSGDDPGYTFRYLLHNYLGDLLLGEGPWLNSTTVCSFPEPWYRKPRSTYHPIKKDLHPTRALHFYAGTYHNSLYGDLHVFQNTSANTLQMNYGIGTWLLYPTSTADKFAAIGNNVLYKISELHTIIFQADHLHNKYAIDSVKLTSFEPRDPPVFLKRTSHVNPNVIVG